MGTQTSDSIRQKPRLTTGEELAVIVQRAQAFTNASGAAIAVNEGSTDEIVCRARSGSSAPDVGTTLRVEGTFTGICIQTGKELRCDDAETDTRVDTAAIRALGIRSMVVTPIRSQGKVVGVVAVFAPTPHAFTITHVAVLKTMADQVSVLLQNEHKVPDEPKSKGEPHVAPPVIANKPVPLPPPIVIKPVSAPAPAAAPPRSNGSPAPRIETKPIALAAEIGPPVPFPKREENRERKPEPSPVPKASFGTLDAVAAEPQGSSVGKFVLIGVVAAAVLVAGIVWFFLRGHKSSSAPAVQTAQQNPAPADQSTQQNPQPATLPAPTTVAPEPIVVSSVSTPSAGASSNSKVNVSEKADKKNDSKKKEQQATPPAPATIALSHGPSKIAQAPQPDQSPDVDPSLSVGAGSSSGLSSVARPEATATPVMVAQSDLVNARPIHTVPAVYPELAKARRLSAIIVVRATVTKEGKVTNPRLVSGPIIFRDAAFDAVKQWLFKPAELNGQPIEQETEVHVNFHPN